MTQKDKKAVLADLVKLSTENLESLLNTAVECYSDGDLARAEQILKGLILLSPKDARPVALYASTLLLQEKQLEAEEAYEQAYALDPNDMYVLATLGELKLKSLQIEAAAPYLEKLFALDPKGQHPAANRARQLVLEYYKKLGGQQT